jgi:hypothetical protein
MKTLLAVTAWISLSTVALAGPYSPAAGQPGSTAIGNNDPRIVEWASGTSNYLEGSPINAAFTNPAKALGPALGTTNDVTELGDGGQITLSFSQPIRASVSGPDFAVFGNSFNDTYLKLAYVEVSQDDQHWSRMPNVDLTPAPVSTFGAADPTNISAPPTPRISTAWPASFASDTACPSA